MKLDEMTPKQAEMLRLAMQFYRDAESPSEDDIESVFTMLIMGHSHVLRLFVEDAANYQILPETPDDTPSLDDSFHRHEMDTEDK
jgi:hypothetical protein